MILFIINYFLNQSQAINLLLMILITILNYWYKKLIIFMQKKTEDNNIICDEINNINQEINLPILLSNEKCKQNSAFLDACKNGDYNTVEHLLRFEDVNIHETNEFGEGPIFLATCALLQNPQNRDNKCIWILHKAGCSLNAKNDSGFTPLHLAAFEGHRPLIKWFIKKGANLDINPNPAGVALLKGYKKAAAMLLKAQQTKK